MTRFNDALSEPNQDRLEAEGGACIVYTHFGHGYVEDGTLNRRFRDLVTRLSLKNGWFVPVTTLLAYLRANGGGGTITNAQRRSLESRWLSEKLLRGTS